MEINQLRRFVAFARSGSYTAAAKELYITRQAVSKTVRSIENELGIQLVYPDKSNNRVLTTEGKSLAKEAEVIIKSFDAMITRYAKPKSLHDGANTKRRPIKLLCSYATLTSGVPGLLSYLGKFEEAYPACKLNISQADVSQCHRSVVEGRADAALVSCVRNSIPDCIETRLLSIRCAALVSSSSPLAKKDFLDISDLRDQRLNLLSDYRFVYDSFIRECSYENIIFEPASVIDEPSLVVESIRCGQGIGIASKGNFLWPDDIAAVPFRNPHLSWHLFLIRSKERTLTSEIDSLSRYIAAYSEWDCLKETARNMVTP